jgi:serine/threonine protein kinase
MSGAVPKAIFRDALPLGTVIHGYTIRAVLGRGGFGTTYHATDQLDQSFAIKEYFPRQFAVRQGLEVVAGSEQDRANLADCRQRFLFEAKTLCQLGKTAADDGIVKVLTFFEANGTAYIVMEFLSGETLEEALKRTPGGLPSEQLRSFLRRILSSLARVHGAGLVHRDIKPANIFIREDGRPVLIDFGSARNASPNQDTTYTQIFSGSYAPIEQISGSPQGTFSDIYALGAVCYRAIGGTLADAFTRHQSMLRGRPDPLVPAVQLGVDRYPMHLLRMVDRALAVNPEDRPQAAKELLAALDNATGASDATVLRPANRRHLDRQGGNETERAPPRRAIPLGRWKKASIAGGILFASVLGISAAVLVLDRADRGEAEAWAELLANPGDDGYQSYLAHFPNGAHQLEAHARLTALADAKAWAEVSTAPSDAGYRGYLGRFPMGAHKREAQLGLDVIAEASAWAEISGKPSDTAYQSYLDRFPQGAHRAEAIAHQGDLAEVKLWTEVMASGSEAAYQSYLERFPEGLHRGDAEAHLAAVAEWRKLRDTGSADDIAAFLGRHSNEPFAGEARQKLTALRRAQAEADAAWDQVKGAEDQKVLQAYLDKYSASAHSNDARQRLAILRGREAAAAWARVKDSADPRTVEAYLNDYPGSPFEPLAKARLAEIKRRADLRGSSPAQGRNKYGDSIEVSPDGPNSFDLSK